MKMKMIEASKNSIPVRSMPSFPEIAEKNRITKIQRILEGIKHVKNVPHYPYIVGELGQKYLNNSSCAPFPTLFEIRFTNTYWQSQTAENWTFHVFGAYLDIRELNSGGPSIRILGVVDREIQNGTAYCQIWFESDAEPTISQIDDYELAWVFGLPQYRKHNGFVPYIWNCPIPDHKKHSTPLSVSVVGNECDQATTNVKIEFEKLDKKQTVAVCVRAMNFPQSDISVKLVEWLEIIKLLGADKVFLYEQNVHPNISKVLDFYTKLGFVNVTKTSFSSGHPNEVSLSEAFDLNADFRAWMTEIVPLNDCLYRNLNSYKYLAVMDVDELFIPSNLTSWPELIEDLENKYGKSGNVTSFAFRNTIFHPEISLDTDSLKNLGIPSYLHALREVYRGCDSRPSGHGTKCFHNPLRVKSLHNHYPFKCLDSCKYVEVDPSYADAHHHRFGFLETKFCQNDTFVIDTTLWRWKDKIIDNVSNVLSKLNLFMTSLRNTNAFTFSKCR